MLRKFAFAILLFLACTVPSFGQQVTWGPVLKDDINLHHRQFISVNPEHYLILRNNYTAELRAWNNFGDFKLDSYDKNFNQVLSVTLSPKLGKQELRPEFGLDLKNNLYIVSSDGDQKAKTAYYYYQKLDAKTLQLGAPVKFGEGHHNQFFDPSYCSYRISNDSTRVLVVTMNFGKEYANTFGIYILDKDMKPQLAKSIKLPVPAEGCSLQSCFLDDLGNAYLVIETKIGDYDKPAARTKEVYCIKNITGELIKLPLKDENGTLTDVIVEETPKQSIICMGMYASEDPEVSNGYVYARFNKQTLAVEATMSKPFSSKFIQQSMDAISLAKTDSPPALKSYYLNSLVPMASGKTLMLAERTIERTNSGTQIFENFEIAAVMFDKVGNILWAKKFQKGRCAMMSIGYAPLESSEVKTKSSWFTTMPRKTWTNHSRKRLESTWGQPITIPL